jgi:pimeloyl-ACP methyl ester carboxylesterase
MSAAERGPLAELRNRRGERLEFAWHEGSPAGAGVGGPSAVAILAHGVTSNMDRPYLVALGDALALAGISALRFSFSGNGGSEGRFEEATPTKEVEDAASVVDALAAAGSARVAWAGHSMGSAVGMMLAARDDRVRALVSLAGMFHVARFFERHFSKLPFGAPMLGKANCPWSRALAEDAARIGSLHDAARRVLVPWMIVHGDADEMAPYFEDAKDMVVAGAASDSRSRHGITSEKWGPVVLTRLHGVDHRFTGAIPRLVAAVVPWLVSELATKGSRDG